MKTLSFIQSAILLLATAFPISTIASPVDGQALARRASETHRNAAFVTPAPRSIHSVQDSEKENISLFKRETDNDWAGLVHEGPPSGTTGPYTLVQADIVISTPVPPGNARGDGIWQGRAFVGLDGASGDDDAHLHAGVGWQVQRIGNSLSYSYTLYYEFYPDPPVLFMTDFPVKVDDVMFFSVRRVSETEGQIVILNTSTKQQQTIHVTAPTGKTLPGKTAEWIVSTVKGAEYARYQNIQFDACLAQTTEKYIGLGGAATFDLSLNGRTVTGVGQGSSTDFTVDYIGP